VCQLCGRHYYGVHRSKQVPAYVCSASWANPYGKKCPAKSLRCSDVESRAKEMIRDFLENPETFLAEVEKRKQLERYTVGGIGQRIANLERQYRQTIEDERKAFRLLTEEAFNQERSLLKARRSWLKDETEREKAKLATAQRLSLSEDRIKHTREQLERRLDGTGDEDWRFIMDALGVQILAFGDGTWDIEISVPATSTESETPWSSCTARLRIA